MTSRMRRRVVTAVAAAFSALALLATTAAVAAATVPAGFVGGHAMNVGRGGVFRVTPPSGWSTASTLGGLAISAAVVALVAWVAIRSDNRARARLALAPSDSSTGQARPAGTEDQERKAA
jgi:hypothetical protein